MRMQAERARPVVGIDRRAWKSRVWRRNHARHGVSDVVATILLLGLTVTLFSAIFAFVTKFPSPPAQNVDQFQATLVTGSGSITKLAIEQTGGPSVPPGDHVFLVASRTVTNWQFSRASGILVSWGTSNSTSGWSTGQFWTTTFSPGLTMPTNITIYVVSSTSLLYTTTVPGVTPNEPPVISSVYPSPSEPAAGAAFVLYAQTSAYASTMTVTASFAAVPGLTTLGTGGNGTVSLTYTVSTGLWSYSVPASKTTTNGTYEVFLSGVNSKTGVKFSASFAFTIGGTSSGGGSGSGFYVTVGLSPQQPPYPLLSPKVYLTATITYNGTTLNVPVSVSFKVAQTPAGYSASTTTVSGQSGLTISGPGKVLVYSKTAFGSWIFNSTVTVTATATLTGVGTQVGALNLGTQKLVGGLVRPLTTGLGGTTNITGSVYTTQWSHSCTSTSCPFLYVDVWDNYGSVLGFPGTSVYFSGTVYVTGTGGTTCPTGCNTSALVTNSTHTLVTPGTTGSFTSLNVESQGSTTVRMAALTWWKTGVTVTFTVRLTVYWGSLVIGHVVNTYVSTHSMS